MAPVLDSYTLKTARDRWTSRPSVVRRRDALSTPQAPRRSTFFARQHARLERDIIETQLKVSDDNDLLAEMEANEIALEKLITDPLTSTVERELIRRMLATDSRE